MTMPFGGVLASGVIPGRPKDSIGFQATWLKVSDQLRATQMIKAETDKRLSFGLSTIISPPTDVEGDETILERRCDVSLRAGVRLMPDLPYVVRPNAAQETPNAIVTSIRVTLDF